jgi:UDP:flavonoid glycosyltransferase YjiC (YdhE family)
MNKLVKKPLLLIFPFDVLAHYTRCLTLAGYLRNHFEIKFLYSEKYISFVEAEGYLTFSGAALNAEEVIENLKRFDFSWLHESQLEHLLLDHLRVFEELKPDVVLGDTIPTLKMAAQKIQVPYISLMNGYMSRYYGQARQLPTAHPLHSYLKNLPKRLVEYLVEIGEQRSFKDIHRPFTICHRTSLTRMRWKEI